MSKAKTPLQVAKEKFGDKAKLVEAVQALANADLWLGRTNDDKGLARVSNAKLIRLHNTFSIVKEKFGTRDKLIAAIADLETRAKDEGYKKRLGAYPVPRLYDLFQSATKRAKHASKAEPKKAETPAKAEPKKADAAKKEEPKAAPPAKKEAAPKAAKKTKA